ncbi:MAG: DUF2254 domain-containing protein [Anaerolineae bacterium]|nr:DUF2254 domain-containing protein [Anaerolineae bacterium]RIK13123.1 MAG: hypothetical protein DCC51_16480 [Anaerolineae bacterium]
MRTRAMRRVTARYTWDRLRVSFWFVPAIMALVAVPLAWIMYEIDARIPNELLADSRLVLSGDVDALRSTLVSIATTVLATAGVVFTLLTLPLSTVAAQYGSRLLRVFLRDRTTQLVLGMFVGTFVYCIAAAFTILPAEIEPASPQLTATLGLLMMMATFGSLILLVQHISTMLQAPNIAAAAGEQLMDVVRVDDTDDVRSADNSGSAARREIASLMESSGHLIHIAETGYIQTVDPQILLTLARENDLLIRLLQKPGAFVRSGEAVAGVWPPERITEQRDKQIRRAFRVGNQRTPTQDVETAVNQLVEMAVRAMSPAINDPFTAMTCLDHIGNGLTLFVRQGEESLNTYDRDGRLRLIFEPVTFAELLSTAFDMLRHCSCDNADVLLHMLAVINDIGQETKTAEARRLLRHHAGLICAESMAGRLIEEDRRRIQQCAQELDEALSSSPPI